MTDPTALALLFKQAAEIASQVPEPLREIAFQRALDALQGPPARVPEVPPARQALPSRAPAGHSIAKGEHSAEVTTLLETLDRTELAALLRGRKVLDRALLLLRAAQHHGIEALTPNDIATVLAKKFREPTKPNAVRMALDRSPTYTDRRPSAGSYIYTLMASGEEYLASLESSPAAPDKPVARHAGNTKKVRARAVAAAKSTDDHKRSSKTAPVKRASSGGRPGPKAALEALLSEGFFESPRTMSDILTHLSEQKTYTYKTSDMTATLQRMIRQGRLSRSRNAEEQFQYTAR